MAILEGGHIVPPPHSSYIQKPCAIRVKPFLNTYGEAPCNPNVQCHQEAKIPLILKVTCQNGDGEYQRILSFMLSCRNLDVLPVAAQTSSSSSLLAYSILIIPVIIISLVIIILKHTNKQPSLPLKLSTYIHYSMSDDQFVRQLVTSQVNIWFQEARQDS